MTNPPPELAALQERYAVERELGRGGMATVYLARDLKHDRQVAIKVLRPELAAMLGPGRFLSEIRTTAALQHPHILPLFDSGEVDGLLYYVMPYVEGETLRERLQRETQLDVDEALAIARDVADALGYAHRNGIVHRDVKPANILLRDGRPVVSDFGIALAVSAAGGGRITETGLSLGTPHYMSPEQASADREVNARSDVYSLGCVLYEMLAGEPPYTGPTSQSILAKILTEDAPTLTQVRTRVPAHVAAVVACALEKLPADRFKDAGAFRAALEDPTFRYGQVAGTTSEQRAGLWNPLSIAAVLAALGLGLGWAWTLGSRPQAEERPSLRGTLPVPTEAAGGVAISPDGRWIVASLMDRSTSLPRLMIRPADDPTFTAVEGTSGAVGPRFSPDGRSVVYGDFTRLDQRGLPILKVPVSGGPPEPVGHGNSQAWGPQDRIWFSRADSVFRVDAAGGEPEWIGTVGDAGVGQGGIPWMNTLPDGNGVLFSTGVDEASRVALLDARERSTVVLAEGGWAPIYVSSGHLLYLYASAPPVETRESLTWVDLSGTETPIPVFAADIERVARGRLPARGAGLGVARRPLGDSDPTARSKRRRPGVDPAGHRVGATHALPPDLDFDGEPTVVRRTQLFSTGPYETSVLDLQFGSLRKYDVHPDGDRFIMTRDETGTLPPEITFVSDWLDALRATVGEGG